MFDYIKNELFCPFCGVKQMACGFQTKDFRNCMYELDILKLRGTNYTTYAPCSNCNNWIELNISEEGVHTEKEGRKQILKRQKEIANIFKKKVKRK